MCYYVLHNNFFMKEKLNKTGTKNYIHYLQFNTNYIVGQLINSSTIAYLLIHSYLQYHFDQWSWLKIDVLYIKIVK